MTMSAARRATHAALALHVDRRGAHRREGLRARLHTVLTTLAPGTPAELPTPALIDRVLAVLADATVEQVWLTLAVVNGRLPDQAEVEQAVRTTRLDGAGALLSGLLLPPRPGWPVARGPWRTVRVVTGEVLVDVHHTARTGLATGIQRVARQTAQRWYRDHAPRMVGWTRDMRALRPLTDDEQAQALHGNGTVRDEAPSGSEVLVPWHCTYVLPELMTETPRARSLQAMLRYSGTQGAMIGFDCVPLTSAETIADGMGAGFSMMLTAIAHGRRIATISEAAAQEYRGWRTMLSGAGLQGPEITAISLPVEAVEPTAGAMAEAGELLRAGRMPVVLCVGSHEPRKNHLAVLHAAELLWREGAEFTLVFVGGNSWNSERFTDRLRELREAGRPVESLRALSDDLLWAAYRLARCVVFPSMNEGFGLPVAEALASGTPAITSGFGSMAEIAAEGGALLVDPRDDHAILDALRSLVTDDAVHARLSAEARERSERTWEHYAAETWAYLVEGQAPTSALTVAPAVDSGVGEA